MDHFIEKTDCVVVYHMILIFEFLLGRENDLSAHPKFIDGYGHRAIQCQNPFKDKHAFQNFQGVGSTNSGRRKFRA
jgi:hypothetical protein